MVLPDRLAPGPRAALLALALLAGLGCGRTAGQADDGGTDAGADAGSTPGDAGVVPPGATALTATRSGGFAVPMCPRDAGTVLADTFHLALDGGALDAVVCRRPRMELVAVARTLSLQELTAVRAALAGLSASTAGCGADKPELRVALETPSGPLRLVDDFYACQREAGVVYVDGMDALFGALDQLVP